MIQDSLSAHETAVHSQHTTCALVRSPQAHDTTHLLNKVSLIQLETPFFFLLIPPGPKGNLGIFFMFRMWAQAQGTWKHIKLLDFSSPTPPSFFQKRVFQSLKQVQKQTACVWCQQALKSSTPLNHCTGMLWQTKCHRSPTNSQAPWVQQPANIY